MITTAPAARITSCASSGRKRKAVDFEVLDAAEKKQRAALMASRPPAAGHVASAADMCTDESACSDIMERSLSPSGMTHAPMDLAVTMGEQQLVLQEACACGNHSVVDQLLLSTGVSTTATTPEGLTLLHLAASGSGSVECCKRLLRAEPALLTARCHTGWTAALHAARAGNWDVVSMLETWS